MTTTPSVSDLVGQANRLADFLGNPITPDIEDAAHMLRELASTLEAYERVVEAARTCIDPMLAASKGLTQNDALYGLELILRALSSRSSDSPTGGSK